MSGSPLQHGILFTNSAFTSLKTVVLLLNHISETDGQQARQMIHSKETLWFKTWENVEAAQESSLYQIQDEFDTVQGFQDYYRLYLEMYRDTHNKGYLIPVIWPMMLMNRTEKVKIGVKWKYNHYSSDNYVQVAHNCWSDGWPCHVVGVE